MSTMFLQHSPNIKVEKKILEEKIKKSFAKFQTKIRLNIDTIPVFISEMIIVENSLDFPEHI